MKASAFTRRLRPWLRRHGCDVVRYPLPRDPAVRRVQLLNHLRVNVVFDVGANAGQYAGELREHGYRGRIVSFEPLSSAHAALVDSARGDTAWAVVHAALADYVGTATMNRAANSTSSSLLPMLRAHRAAAPQSVYVGTEEVPVLTLDSVFSDHCRPDERSFVKIDAQGLERSVLRGAESVLSLVYGIQVELSLVPLYEGGMLFREALDLIENWGFDLVSVEPGFSDPRTGRLLQFDGIFIRPEPVPRCPDAATAGPVAQRQDRRTG